MSIRVNIGCGQSPTDGWHNYDNSWSIRFARIPLLCQILFKSSLFSKQQREFVTFVKKSHIRWADAKKCIPEENGTVDVVYSSHMLEHLDKEDASKFLKNVRRVLRSGGIVRIAVPDIRHHVENYLQDGDANKFIDKTLLSSSNPKTLFEKLKYLTVGDRHHQWMYDGNSLCRLLSSEGFIKPCEMKAGTTMIKYPEPLNLEEGMPESIFVEALNP
ncbi:MAG: class I SAM-dependent methyltransferase [Candidatus Roizmanbacteria bacterium]|nr:class I SAM-dependent methyltransferase [Candidatus Roizmanbacteria bacterium]